QLSRPPVSHACSVFRSPVSSLALLFGSSALRSSPLSERLFTTIASADSSKALTPEVSPSKVSALSERAVWLYLMRLGGSWTSPVPSQRPQMPAGLCLVPGTGVRYSTRTKSKLQFIQLVRVHRVMTPVPGELVARIRPLCQFVFLRSLLCLALLSTPDLTIRCLHFGYGLHQFRRALFAEVFSR